MGHARALLGTPDRAFQEQLAKRAVSEDLSVREVEEAIRLREDSRPASPGEPARDEAAAAGSARARGAARRLPRDSRPDLDEPAPRSGRGRVRDPRGPRAHLPGDHRGQPQDTVTVPTIQSKGSHPGLITWSSLQATSIGCSTPRRIPTASAAATSGPRALSAAAPAGSSREKSSHTTAAMRVSRSRR